MKLSRFTRVYEAILDHCSPFIFDPPWKFLAPDSNCLFLHDSYEQVAKSLLARFKKEALLESGVMTESGSSAMVLNPVLLSDDRRILALRNRRDKVINLMTSRGLCREGVPLFELLEDVKTRREIERARKDLFVVFTFNELVLCRALGVPAVTSALLQHLSFEGLRHFSTVTGALMIGDPIWKKPTRCPAPGYDSVPPEGCCGDLINYYYPLQLTFIIGNLLDGSECISGEMSEVARFFNDATRHCGLQFSAECAWWLSNEDIANLEFRRRLGSVNLIRNWFFIEDRIYFQIGEFAEQSSPPSRSDPKPDLTHTMAELVKLGSLRPLNSDKERKYSKLKEAYEKIVEVDLFRPLIELALATPNALEMNQQVALAHLFKQLHGLMPLVETAMARTGQATRIDANTILISKEHQETLCKLIEMIAKLSKSVSSPEVHKWGC